MKVFIKVFFILFVFVVNGANASEGLWYQQQVENAVVTQEMLDVSAKLLREHKDIEIQEKFAIPVFHKQAGELETAPQSFCRTCHTPLPHQNALRTRTFNNMHVRYIACETCHIDNANANLTYRWFDVEKQVIAQSDNLLRIGKDIDNESQRPVNPKIAPLLNNERLFLLKDDAFAKKIAMQWKAANESEKVALHAKIHAPLNWQKTENTHQGTPCQECHNDKKSMLDLSDLGATSKQIQAISTHIIPRYLAHYKNDQQRMTIREMLH
jgi:RNase P subunit RPR2